MALWYSDLKQVSPVRMSSWCDAVYCSSESGWAVATLYGHHVLQCGSTVRTTGDRTQSSPPTGISDRIRERMTVILWRVNSPCLKLNSSGFCHTVPSSFRSAWSTGELRYTFCTNYSGPIFLCEIFLYELCGDKRRHNINTLFIKCLYFLLVFLPSNSLSNFLLLSCFPLFFMTYLFLYEMCYAACREA
jgi:hypothetical protein